MSLWLMRHSRVVLPEPTCYGVSDVPMDADHLMRCAQRMAQRWPHGASLVCSQMQRTQRLAEQVRQINPAFAPHVVDARLNEMNFGQWEGVPWAKIPQSALDAWVADFPQHRFGGQESVQQVIDRVVLALQAHGIDPLTLAGMAGAASASSGENEGGALPVVWICHAGVLRAVAFIRQALAKKRATLPASAFDSVNPVSVQEAAQSLWRAAAIETAAQWPAHAIAFGDSMPVP